MAEAKKSLVGQELTTQNAVRTIERLNSLITDMYVFRQLYLDSGLVVKEGDEDDLTIGQVMTHLLARVSRTIRLEQVPPMIHEVAMQAARLGEGDTDGEKFICPYCGETYDSKEKGSHGIVVTGGKLGYKFSLLLMNDRVGKGVFLCDKCNEMFTLPSSSFIRVVKD